MYGPVRTVAWEERAARLLPIPIKRLFGKQMQ